MLTVLQNQEGKFFLESFQKTVSRNWDGFFIVILDPQLPS